MKYLDNIVREFFQQICFKLLSKRSKKCQMQFSFGHKTAAPGEARTHGLQIMRLTRCLLRYRGWLKSCKVDGLPKKHELLMLEWVSPLAFLLQSILKRYPRYNINCFN